MPENEARTDVRFIDRSVAREMPFPAKIESEFRVHIDPDAYRRMKEHAATTDEVELCGVLVGDICVDDQGFFLNVVGVIEGEGANNYGAQVTFTHDTWSHINDIKDSHYPDQKIVGWYHTHPGFGVFLSEMDSFIQDNFFNQPYQVAIVIETKDETEGCFCWVNGKSTPLKRYWVGGREITLVTGKVEAFQAEHNNSAKDAGKTACSVGCAPRSDMPFLQILLLGTLTVVFGFFFGSNWGAGQERERILDTEVLSLIEYAAQAKLMNIDLDAIEQDVNSVKQALQGNHIEDALKELNKVDSFVSRIKSGYLKNRRDFRNELMELRQRRHTLGDKVEYNSRRSDEVSRYVADLYIMRLKEFMDQLRPFDASRLDRKTLMSLKLMLDRAIMNFPENKQMVRVLFPELMGYFYPEADRQQNSVPPVPPVK